MNNNIINVWELCQKLAFHALLLLWIIFGDTVMNVGQSEDLCWLRSDLRMGAPIWNRRGLSHQSRPGPGQYQAETGTCRWRSRSTLDSRHEDSRDTVRKVNSVFQVNLSHSPSIQIVLGSWWRVVPEWWRGWTNKKLGNLWKYLWSSLIGACFISSWNLHTGTWPQMPRGQLASGVSQ